MIEVKHLKKTYIGKNKEASRGLSDVSFKLGDTGFVFVLGKSGSGKSTLLNLIGGLDTPTEGEVLVENKKLKDFNEKEINLYKSYYCGFIFQDYRLINELNVYENILISLEINNDLENAIERIDTLLKKVGLDGYQTKMINELSGGEKQRVAIVRCLIKNPKIILCDEPTGNLDKKTSKLILDTLKEASKNCLVFMVSHDKKACNKYASRRLIISDGYLINDSTKDETYKNEMTLKESSVFLPNESNLTWSELKKINELLKENKIKNLDYLNDGFYRFDDSKITSNFSKNLQNSTKINKNLKFKLLKRYFFKDKISSFLNAFVFSFLTILIILVETFLYFDSEKIIIQNIDYNYEKDLIITKTEPSYNNGRDTFIGFNDKDIEFLDELGGYHYINYSNKMSNNGYDDTEFIKFGYKMMPSRAIGENGFYPCGYNGTAIVDEEYLNYKFNGGNKVKVLAGKLNDEENKTGLILTDYLCDTYNENNKTNISYEDMIGIFNDRNNAPLFRVNAIIESNYKTRFKNLYDKYLI